MANKVLVVDDEKLIVKGLKFSLEQDGMQVECAYDGEEALECARKNSYDMILLDLSDPQRRFQGGVPRHRGHSRRTPHFCVP